MRRSSRVAAATDARTSALAPLPPPLVLRIFASLPLSDRGRAACVARGWRAVLAEPSLWTRLDLSRASGFAPERVTDALLRKLAAKARGQLQQLNVSGRPQYLKATTLLQVVGANAGSLLELHVDQLVLPGDCLATLLDLKVLDALARAAPRLRILGADAECTWQEAPLLMRAEPPLAPLQLRDLSVNFSDEGFGGLNRVTPFAAALADATLHPTLEHVSVWMADLKCPQVTDALVDALLSRPQLRELALKTCRRPAPAPLARLLQSSALARLEIHRVQGSRLFDEAGAALVADALLNNTTLEQLLLFDARLCSDVPAACVLLRALVGHPSLRKLVLLGEAPPLDGRAALGSVLAALVAADAPALHELCLYGSDLGDNGLAPIVNALRHIHHLRKLDLRNTRSRDMFIFTRLLPAVQTNASLRELKCCDDSGGLIESAAAVEAEKLVRSRPPHG